MGGDWGVPEASLVAGNRGGVVSCLIAMRLGNSLSKSKEDEGLDINAPVEPGD